MKKIWSIIIIIALLLSLVVFGAFSFTASAEENSYYDYIIHNGKAEIVSVSLPSTVSGLVIPSELDGYPVTRINYAAFSGCSLQSVFIPYTVTYIDQEAFSDCYNLKYVTLQYGLSEIGYCAFADCRSLESITIPDSVTSIGAGAFSGCSSLLSVTIPDSVATIGDHAFYQCTSLKSATIGDRVTSIGDSVFGECSKLTSIFLPDSIQNIGEGAFLLCTSLPSITIPNRVESIGKGAFYGCSSLSSVIVPDSVTSMGSRAFYACSSLSEITLPFVGNTINGSANTHFGYIFGATTYSDNIDYVPAFLKKVTITKATNVDENAFYACRSLTSITLSDSVTNIGQNAFRYCSSLTEITVPFVGATLSETENTHIGYFFGASSGYNNEDYVPVSLKKVTITNAKTIGEHAFRNCVSLTSVNISDRITTIEDYAFYGCTSLTSVAIGNGVTSMGKSAFYNCTSLEAVYITDIAKWCEIEFFVNSNPLYYSKKLYLNNILVTDLVVPDGVATIGNYAFENCSSLTSVTIPDSVKTIGNKAFYGCNSLTFVTIGTGVTSMGRYAFCECTSLETVYITDIAKWCEIEFALFSNPLHYSKKLYLNNKLVTDLIIPNGVTRIGNYAFEGCSSLTSVIIPNSVVTIGDEAFEYCRSLDSVVIRNGVTSIGNRAFAFGYITSITIPISITNVGEGVFEYGSSWLNVWYTGNEIDRNTISIESNNTTLTDAIWHYNTCIDAHTYSYVCDALCNKCEWIRKAQSHTYTGATCNVPQTCVRCGDTVGEALGHNYNDATCDVPQTCVRCGDTVGEALGHDYEENVTKATFSSNGKITYKCSGCGYVSSTTKTIYRPHSFTLSATSYTCDGAVKTPTVTVKDSAGESISSSNYTVAYQSGRKDAGVYNVTVTMKGNYSGIKTLTFYIEHTYTGACDVDCDGCFAERAAEEDHIYDNDCDINCNICGNIRVVDHLYNNEKSDSTYHWKECDCGAEADRELHSHDTACDVDCNICFAVREVEPHDYADATCTSPKTCKVCGEPFGSAIAHTYDKQVVADKYVKSSASCSSATVYYKSCKCGAKGTETFTSGSKLSHKSDTGTVTKKATCSATGTKTYKCTLCKATIKTDTIAKVAHKYDSGKVTKAATCKATGVKTYTCSACKGTKTETIAKSTTHTYSNNCDKSCNICGKTRTAGAHKYSNSCDTTCNYCNAKRTIKHTYSNACDTSCNVCKATRSITHAYKTTTTKATLSKNGSIVKKCTVCGKMASNTAIKYAKTFKLSTTTYTYNGGVKTPTVTVKDSAGKILKKNTDYTVTYASGRKNAGTYKVTVKMIGKYSGTKTLTFKINPAKLSSYKLSATSYTYDGKVKAPSVTVKNANGTKLTKNTHYTVTYASGRKNVDTYKVTIKGKGNYTGSKTLTFKINPAKTTVSKLTAGNKSITVNITKKSTQVTGYQIQYSTSKTFSNATTKTISSYNTTKYTLKSLSAKKTYYVRVRTYKTVNGTKYYSGWSTYKYVKTK